MTQNNPTQGNTGTGSGRLRDVVYDGIGDLLWDDANLSQSLGTVYRKVIDTASNTKRWYEGAKRPAGSASRFLRFAALGLISVAGLYPLVLTVIDGILARRSPSQQLPGLLTPAWASLAAGLAAVCYELNKISGVSSAYVRYQQTEVKVLQELHCFDFTWQLMRAAKEPTDQRDRAVKLLNVAQASVANVMSIMASETAEWALEFQQELANLDALISRAKTELDGGGKGTGTQGSGQQKST